MPITSSNWAELVVPGISKAFYIGYGRRPSLLDRLYTVQSSNRANEVQLGIGNTGIAGWADFEKTGHTSMADFARGYKFTSEHREFTQGMQIQRKLVEDDQFNVINQRARMIGDSAFRFREQTAADVFNNAFTASGTDAYGFGIAGSDGVALGSASHPRNPDDAATTDSNTSNITLTNANLRTARQNMMAFKDDTGSKLNVMPDELLVPPELEDDAIVQMKSLQDPLSANNAINPQAGRFNVITWHYLTSTTNWFMMDAGRRADALQWFERSPLEFSPSTLDTDTMVLTMRAYNRFSRGFSDWRWIYCAGA